MINENGIKCIGSTR